MGAARNIPTYRVTCPANQNMDGISGRAAGWIVGTGTSRTRKSNNNAGAALGSYMNAGETWYGIIPVRVSSTGHIPGRVFNWHDEAVSGYSWGSVSPVAWDCYLPGGHSFDTGFPTEFTVEYTSGCAGAAGLTHWNIPFLNDEYQFFFVELLLSNTCTGRLKVYVQNSTTSLSDGPVLNLTNIKTLNPAAGWFPGVQFWQGAYVPAGFTSGVSVQADHGLSMWGQSWQQAWDDVPAFVEFQENTTAGHDATCVALGSINTSTFPIPALIAAQLSDPPGAGGGGTGGGGGVTGQLGKTTIGAAWDNYGTPYTIANKITVPASKTYRVDSLYGYLRGNPSKTGTENVKAIIWADSAGLPGNVKAVFDSATVIGGPTGSNAAWSHFTATPPSLTAGDYWIGFINTGTSQAAQVAYDTAPAGSNQFRLNSTYASIAVNDPYGTPDGNSPQFYSVYVSWTDVTPAINPVNTAPPVATVLAAQGSVLTCDTGVWQSVTTITYTYQWRRDTAGNGVYADIGGQTAAAHTCVLADVGCHLVCNVTATNSVGATTQASNPTQIVTAAVPVMLTSPLISGDARVGNTMTVLPGTYSNTPTLTYQWARDNGGDGVFVNIGGQTATTYLLTLTDLGSTVRVVETATNTGGVITTGANIGPVLATPTSPGTPPDEPPVVLPPALPPAGLGSGVKTGLTEPSNKVRDMGKGLVDPGE